MSINAPTPTASLATSLAAVFWLTLRQLIRGRRLLILSAIFVLPAVLALVARTAPRPPRPAELEFALLFGFLPLVLLPITCLLYSSGMIQDEIEEQTLTYLLIRPIPRALLYPTRLLATYLMTVSVVIVFTVLTALCVWWGSDEMPEALARRVVPLLGIVTLTTFVYTAVFGFLSLYFRRLLAMGVAYILIVEGVLAMMDFVMRKLAVAFYFRVMVVDWIDTRPARGWNIDTSEMPTGWEAALTLVVAGVVLTALGALILRNNEYRVKTPGES